MAGISTSINLQDNFTGILYQVFDAVNLGISAMEELNQSMSATVEMTSIEAARESLNAATAAAMELDEAMQRAGRSRNPATGSLPEPQGWQWQPDSLDVFTGSGIGRFEQEVQSANSMLNTLAETQERIMAAAAQTDLLPADALADVGNMQNRLQAIQQRIQVIESNPLNMGTDTANAELEQLRGQLDRAVQEQQALNRAVDSMDIEAANAAYLRLSGTIGNTERYIRDNVDEQGRFNRELEAGTEEAGTLMQTIKGAVAAYMGIAGIKKAFSFIEDCTQAFDTQLNAERQLLSVLANTLDTTRFEFDITADTTGAISEISDIQGSVAEVVVPVSVESRALTSAFDQITDKAAEIQSRGIYGDEAMIAAAAEFSTYFSDVEAIGLMMDTLADYAMGMSGGGEIGSQQMVNYATNLGKIMSGAYDAMTEKGFELTDTQKAIIEGTASHEQIVSALGEEYASMSADMQAAAAISQVVEESWSGLYESMSNTPEGKVIQMTNAWGDMKEVIGGQLYPYVLRFVDVINKNWGTIEKVVSTITTGLECMLVVLSWITEAAISVAEVITDNWSWIEPIVYGIAGALAVYYGAQMLSNIAVLLSKGAHIGMAIAEMACMAVTGKLTAATAAQTAAQYGLNTALYACPLVWILILIIAIIAAIYLVIGVINKVTGESISATGLIFGAIATAMAFVYNRFLALLDIAFIVVNNLHNKFAMFANFFGNIFRDPVASVIHLFGDMADGILGVLENIAKAMDKIFGSSMAETVSGWRDNLDTLVEEAAGKYGSGSYERLISEWNFSADSLGLNRIAYSDAWKAGYSVGESLEESLSFSNLLNGFQKDLEESNLIEQLAADASSIAANTSSIADGVAITEEDLKYLRDIAEQETINRFTTAEITIEQTNHNTVSGKMDLDGVVDSLTDAVNEAVDIIAEGVHE